MPSLWHDSYRRRTWREMRGPERKHWYREQATRVSRGLPPLPKPF